MVKIVPDCSQQEENEKDEIIELSEENEDKKNNEVNILQVAKDLRNCKEMLAVMQDCDRYDVIPDCGECNEDDDDISGEIENDTGSENMNENVSEEAKK